MQSDIKKLIIRLLMEERRNPRPTGLIKHNTKDLILQLLREEGRRADHIATPFYKAEVDEALVDFLQLLIENPNIINDED
tara:strand:- start:517 stop:756 length:240 start_codon:yes stop_codon:yes gene_type:complete